MRLENSSFCTLDVLLWRRWGKWATLSPWPRFSDLTSYRVFQLVLLPAVPPVLRSEMETPSKACPSESNLKIKHRTTGSLLYLLNMLLVSRCQRLSAPLSHLSYIHRSGSHGLKRVHSPCTLSQLQEVNDLFSSQLLWCPPVVKKDSAKYHRTFS